MGGGQEFRRALGGIGSGPFRPINRIGGIRGSRTGKKKHGGAFRFVGGWAGRISPDSEQPPMGRAAVSQISSGFSPAIP